VKEGVQWHIREWGLLGSPANMGFSGFLHFSLHLEAAATLATIPYMFSLGGALATWADSGLHSASSQYKEISGCSSSLQRL
jgi:hypothetical protein